MFGEIPSTSPESNHALDLAEVSPQEGKQTQAASALCVCVCVMKMFRTTFKDRLMEGIRLKNTFVRYLKP